LRRARADAKFAALEGDSVMTRIVLRLLALVAFALAAPAHAQSSPCPGNMASYFNLKLGDSIKCTCPAATGSRTAWGTLRYTVDSDVCRAAVHAGAVTAAGGEVTVYLAEGCPIFRGNAKNGVQSTNYGPYGRTFHFAQAAPACEEQTKDDPVTDCPFSMSVFANMKPGQTWRCKCSETRMKNPGNVYGDARYTTDSNVCTAAPHAGVLQATGGPVTMHTDEGCKRFAAAAKNGITSREWAAYPMSYAFAKPLTACAN
jgi:hypothetical protein